MNENEIREALSSVEDAFKKDSSLTKLMYKADFEEAYPKHIKPLEKKMCSESEWNQLMDKRRDQIHDLWAELDRSLCSSVCNGTADGFPDRKIPVSTHSWDNKKLELSLDYFQELKECLRRIKESCPRDGSMCFELLHPIYWATPGSSVKEDRQLPKLVAPLIGCGITALFLLALDWLSPYFGKSLLLTFILPVLNVIGVLVSVIVVIWLIVSIVHAIKEGSSQHRQARFRRKNRGAYQEKARNNLTNAKKLLAYFQQWAAHTGGGTPDAVKEMDAMIRSFEEHDG